MVDKATKVIIFAVAKDMREMYSTTQDRICCNPTHRGAFLRLVADKTGESITESREFEWLWCLLNMRKAAPKAAKSNGKLTQVTPDGPRLFNRA